MISNNTRIMRQEAETSQMERDFLNVLLDIATTVTSELDLERLLQLIMDKIRFVLVADRCSIFLLDEKRRELWTIAAHGLNGKKIRLNLYEGLTGHVAITGKMMNIKDVYSDPRFSDRIDKKTGYRTHSLLTMPLKGKLGKVIGVFQVINKRFGHFTTDDEKLMKGVAPIVSISIENALLYEKLRHHESRYGPVAMPAPINVDDLI